MSLLGKVFGGTFGFLMGGPLGAILGTVMGHQFDKGLEGIDRDPESGGFQPGDQHRVQMAFFTATFSVMGHLAKVDGTVSKEEIELAEKIMTNMELPANLRQTAQKLFAEGKSPHFPIDAVLEQFRIECHRRSSLIRMFIEIQLQAAYADDELNNTEERLLLHICDCLGFSRFEFETMKRIHTAQQGFGGGFRDRFRSRRTPKPPVQPTIKDAYGVLGLEPSASDAEITRAYRRLMSRNHPDRLVSKGLPEEMMKIATEKTQKIRQAYEMIKKARSK